MSSITDALPTSTPRAARNLTPYDAWALAWLLNAAPNAQPAPDLALVSVGFAPLARHLAELPSEGRMSAWSAMLAGREADRDAIIRAVVDADPLGPPPEVEPPMRPANLGDVRRRMAQEQWLWEGWLPKSRIAGISAAEGVGKTRFAMDLARRIWFGLEWPDGQKATLPSETPTLWICSDGQQDDLVTMAQAFGMPEDSIHFNTPPDEPYGGTDIDGVEPIDQLRAFLGQRRYGLVFIDSLTFATSVDLCAANHVKGLMTPVRDVAQETQTTIVPLLHVSKDGQALGKRIKGIARTITQLESFDPENGGKLRLSVTKSFAKRPPALGVTITEQGNKYDSNPPTGPALGQPGRPSSARNEATAFILDAIDREGPQPASELCRRWEELGKDKSAFWRAKDVLVKDSVITSEGRPLILARKAEEPELNFGPI